MNKSIYYLPECLRELDDIKNEETTDKIQVNVNEIDYAQAQKNFSICDKEFSDYMTK